MFPRSFRRVPERLNLCDNVRTTGSGGNYRSTRMRLAINLARIPSIF
jgi:hypothetical protein